VSLSPWPVYRSPHDLPAVEAVPLAARGLPASSYDAVRRAAQLWPDRRAVTVLPDGARWDRARDITFGALAGQVTRVANLLRTLGVGRGDAVGLLSPNTAELLPAILGAQACGIAAPANPSLRPAEVEHLLSRSRARLIVAAGPELHPQGWHLARAVARSGGASALLALRPTDAEGPPPGLEPLPGVLVGHLFDLADDVPGDRLVDVTPPGADDLAAFFHTGGTTGLPKLAAHTHVNEITDAWAVATMSELTEDDPILAALPLFHINALVVTLLAPLLRGRPVVWAGPLGYRDPGLIAGLWRIVEHHGIAAMSAVPSIYAKLTQIPVDADISSLRLCIVGAAPLPKAVGDRWLAHTGRPLLQGYGLTEATCATTRTFPDHPVPGTVGQRLPYQRVKAVDIDPATGAVTDLPDGVIGTLAIAGPTVFPGYLVGFDGHRPVLDGLGKLHGEWLDTGDLGSVDGDGFVTLAGRAKDVIVRGGHNIDPQVIEAALLSHPLVREAAAVGRIDQYAGEVPVAYVTVSGDVDPGDLLDWAARHVPEAAAAPKEVVVLPALPVTTVGKLHKVTLSADAARRELAPHLTPLGVVPPGDDEWCTEIEGRLTVVLAVTSATARDAVAVVLDRYAVNQRLTVQQPATTP
jgi:fatty-acyl-CoA synthase